ncbi:MAG: PAS domain-containing sensor histidine kinase [Rickettsiales bacterium]
MLKRLYASWIFFSIPADALASGFDTRQNFVSFGLYFLIPFVLGAIFVFRCPAGFTFKNRDVNAMNRYLTQRYVMALSLIALLAVVTYAITGVSMHKNRYGDAVIHVSSKQRLLSQRVALYAVRLRNASGKDRENVAATLRELIASMRSAQHYLAVNSGVSLFVAQDVVNNFLSLAERTIDPSLSAEERDAAARRLTTESGNALNYLNAVFERHKKEADDNAESLRRLELATFLALIAALALEGRLIFFPVKAAVCRMHREIEEKEKLFSLFVKYAPAAVAMFDKELRYLAASDRWYVDYGLKNKEIIGRSHYEIFPEIAKNHPEWKKLHDRTLRGEIIKADEDAFVREDGATEWLRYELHPWYAADGTVGGLIMFTENITERKRMDLMKNEFVSTVNHELRTPLTSIHMSLGILRETAKESMNDNDKRLVELSYRNCDRLTSLVNDILDLEKIAVGKMDYRMRRVEIVSLVKDAIERNNAYAQRYRVAFDARFERDEAYCVLDSGRFIQALTNLLSNACKFSSEGQKIVVRVGEAEDGRIKISVEDKGSGVPESFKNRIFQKFAQADGTSTRSQGGTGLGLSITKSIIEACGGETGFVSREGVGSTFYFLLPRADEKKEEAA